MIVVIQTGNLKAANARLKQLGIVVRGTEEDGTPLPWRDEERYEQCSTPILTDTGNDMYFSIMLSAEQAAKLPKNDTPNFTTLWREDGDLPEDWPVVTVTTYDLDGNPNGTMQQAVGVFR